MRKVIRQFLWKLYQRWQQSIYRGEIVFSYWLGFLWKQLWQIWRAGWEIYPANIYHIRIWDLIGKIPTFCSYGKTKPGRKWKSIWSRVLHFSQTDETGEHQLVFSNLFILFKTTEICSSTLWWKVHMGTGL